MAEEVYITKHLEDQTVREHQFTLRCEVSAPNVDAKWSHNNRKVLATSRVTIASDGYSHILTVKDASKSDDGTYAVVVGGEALISTCRIKIAGPPGAPEAPTVSKITSKSCVVHWRPPADDGGCPPITGYRLKQCMEHRKWEELNGGNILTEQYFKVTGLSEGVEYEFCVSAVNGVGSGHLSSPSKSITAKDPWSDMKLVEGSSYDGRTIKDHLDGTNCNVAAVIVVENYTKWTMESPSVIEYGGYIVKPPVRVGSGMKEIFVGRKTYHCATGTHGTASWKIGGCKVIVMWSTPYNHNSHNNILAVGILKDKDHDADRFVEMERGSQDYFKRGQYYSDIRVISYSNDIITIKGIMSANHMAVATVSFYPTTD